MRDGDAIAACVIGLIVGVAMGIVLSLPAPVVEAQAERPDPVKPPYSSVVYRESAFGGLSVYHIGGKCFAVWSGVESLTSQPVPCPWDAPK